MRIILIGPQGSGKGTLGKSLSARLGIPHISTGDMLRAALQSASDLGEKVRASVHEGKGLVPDDIMNEVVRERLGHDDCRRGYILDGYPRTLAQAEFLDSFANPDYVLELAVSDEVSVDRLSHRRQCKGCGAIYGLNVPSAKEGVCDRCNGALYQRPDDTPAAIRQRLGTYHDETEPLLEYYKPRDIVVSVDGTKKPVAVLEDVLNALNA